MSASNSGNRAAVTSMIVRGRLVAATPAHLNIARGFCSVRGGKPSREGYAVVVKGVPRGDRAEFKRDLKEAFRNSGYAACQVKLYA